MLKKKAKIGMLCMILLLLTACLKEQTINYRGNAKHNVPLKEKKIAITLGYNGISIKLDRFEKSVEEKFPQADLILVPYNILDYSADLERRANTGELEDLVLNELANNNYLNIEDKFCDLSGKDFVSHYPLSAINAIADHGKLYYLPGPFEIQCFLYNKTLFRENGWQVPVNYAEFITLCKKIQETGIRGIQFEFKRDATTLQVFTALGYEPCFKSLWDARWLTDYQDGMAEMIGHMEPAFMHFQEMLNAGILQADDYEADDIGAQMLADRQCAIIFGNVKTQKFNELPEHTDEIAMMPIYSGSTDSDYVFTHTSCYIAANKKLEDEINSEKFNLVQQILDYISTEDGQKALVNNNPQMFYSLVDISAANSKSLEGIDKTIAKGHLVPRIQFQSSPHALDVQAALGDGLRDIALGKATADQVMQACDVARDQRIKRVEE